MGDDAFISGLAALSLSFFICALIGRDASIKAMCFSICIVLYWKFGDQAAIYAAFVLIMPATIERVFHAIISGWNKAGKDHP
ncbi:MAG TPA: hypothetical protein VLK33_08985 [Terriglobales bacterium]|nr:hypothetical protein [Terriglobales bacterium]